VGLEARHVVESTAALRSIRGAHLSDSSNLQQRVHRGGSSAKAMVPAAAGWKLQAASIQPQPQPQPHAQRLQIQCSSSWACAPCQFALPVAGLRTRASAAGCAASSPRCQPAPPSQTQASWDSHPAGLSLHSARSGLSVSVWNNLSPSGTSAPTKRVYQFRSTQVLNAALRSRPHAVYY
jgi:hypothetical protein